jgi:hypothetical protein
MKLGNRTSLSLLISVCSMAVAAACSSTSDAPSQPATGGAQPSAGAGGPSGGGTAGANSGGSAVSGGSGGSVTPAAGSGGAPGAGGPSGAAGLANGGTGGAQPLVNTSWLGRPPAVPLIVRTPYVSVWSTADAPNSVWPTFWTGAVKGFAGIANVDGKAFNFLGSAGAVAGTAMTLVSRSLTPTNTEYVLSGGGVTLTLDFLSPVEPVDLKRQSAPLGYVRASAQANDGKTHAVHLYFDISGEWAHGDSTQKVNWARESVAHQGGQMLIESITPQSPTEFAEVNDYPKWGTAFIATAASDAVTSAIGADIAVRAQGAAGKLDGSLDTNMPRAINDNWPVLGLSFDLGQVAASATPPVTLLVGAARDNAITWQKQPVPALWRSYWATWQAMLADEYDDTAGAVSRAAALDQQIVSDALAAGGEHYAALCMLGLRQAFGGTELVGTVDKPWLMLKEISSDGNMSTVDVVYPASPAFLYTSPLLLKLMLDPLLEYAEGGLWPKTFAEHDLGASYPNGDGHNDGGGENMEVEETANMLLMMAAYAQRASLADGKAFASSHYKIAKQWADYLVKNTLDPACQNQTDDFTGHICHSVNLALKGIIAVGAMSVLAGIDGNTADQTSYLAQAQGFISQWATMGQNAAQSHMALTYTDATFPSGVPLDPGNPNDTADRAAAAQKLNNGLGWSLKYNALYDGVLGLNLIPKQILTEESNWYATLTGQYGIVLDPRHGYTKSDWEIFVAASIDDTTERQKLIDGVYNYATSTPQRVPFSDLYNVADGTQNGFSARPVQGGMFALLTRTTKR